MEMDNLATQATDSNAEAEVQAAPDFTAYDKDGNEWLVHSLKKAEVGQEIGLDFEPEAIHIMRLNESEEDFDKRLESYGGDEDAE